MSKELYEYILEMREYIVKLETRIAKLEEKVNPPLSRDLGNGRRGLTQHGMNSLFDSLQGTWKKDENGEWKKVR